MSTYLAAWAVLPNDFKYKETFSSGGLPIRVYARKNAVDQGLVDFAVDVTKKSVDYFQDEYFLSELKALPPKIGLKFVSILRFFLAAYLNISKK